MASGTLFTKTDSWYMGANIPGKPKVLLPYVGGLQNYTAICEKVIADGYPGLQFDAPTHQPA